MNSQQSHVSWWLGGLVVVAAVVGAMYIMVSRTGLMSDLASAPTASPVTATPIPASVANSSEVGAPAPAKVTSQADLKQAEEALQGDPELKLGDIDQDLSALQ